MSVGSSGSLRTACPEDREERNYRSVWNLLPLGILLSRGFCPSIVAILWTANFELA